MSPRSRLAVVIAFVIVGNACDQQNIPSAPTPPPLVIPPPVPSPPVFQSLVTLSGRAVEYTTHGSHPAAHLRLLIRALDPVPPRMYLVTTDDAGRYRIENVPSGSMSIRPDHTSGYYAPCAGGGTIATDAAVDIHVVAAETLSTVGLPARIPIRDNSVGSTFPMSVIGKVYSMEGGTQMPVAGALIVLDGDTRDASRGARTLTDATGAYFVCPEVPGTGADQTFNLRVDHPGYSSRATTGFLSSTNLSAEVNVELTPKGYWDY